MRYDATGIDPSAGFPIIDRPGWYPFRISLATEKESKNGDYQVVVDAVCLDPRFRDYGVRHWVTFLPKGTPGAGMAIHFLKCIGEPWEGQIDVTPFNWERKMFMGKVSINRYKADDGTEKVNNKFEAISPFKQEELVPGPADLVSDPADDQKTAFDD